MGLLDISLLASPPKQVGLELSLFCLGFLFGYGDWGPIGYPGFYLEQLSANVTGDLVIRTSGSG